MYVRSVLQQGCLPGVPAIPVPQVLHRGWKWFTNVAVTITTMSVLLSVSGACAIACVSVSVASVRANAGSLLHLACRPLMASGQWRAL